MSDNRAGQTRANWLETIEKHKLDSEIPGSEDYWSPALDCASRDYLISIQNEKLKAVTPFSMKIVPFTVVGSIGLV